MSVILKLLHLKGIDPVLTGTGAEPITFEDFNRAILLGDKGYDDQKIRQLARQHEVRPLIKHREFTSLHKAWNARLDADLYGQRSQSETVNSTLKRKYGAFVRSRRWWKQFRELTIACLIHNVDRSL